MDTNGVWKILVDLGSCPDDFLESSHELNLDMRLT